MFQRVLLLLATLPLLLPPGVCLCHCDPLCPHEEAGDEDHGAPAATDHLPGCPAGQQVSSPGTTSRAQPTALAWRISPVLGGPTLETASPGFPLCLVPHAGYLPPQPLYLMVRALRI